MFVMLIHLRPQSRYDQSSGSGHPCEEIAVAGLTRIDAQNLSSSRDEMSASTQYITQREHANSNYRL